MKSFLPSNQSVLVHGNELLGGLIAGYDKEKEWRQTDHTFDNIVTVLGTLFPERKSRRETAARMVGYLVFDALVGNTDRHHQNWGVLLESRAPVPGGTPGFTIQLAPTFDHASSLGRELTDEARARYLKEGTVERYIEKGRGGIFADAGARRGLSPMAVARMLDQQFPEFFVPWQTRVNELPDAALAEIVGRVPDERISTTGRSFVLALLSATRKLLQKPQ